MHWYPWFSETTTVILRPFLHRGHQLGRVHQVGAVADQDEDLTLGLRQPDAQTRRESRSPCTSIRIRDDSAGLRSHPTA